MQLEILPFSFCERKKKNFQNFFFFNFVLGYISNKLIHFLIFSVIKQASEYIHWTTQKQLFLSLRVLSADLKAKTKSKKVDCFQSLQHFKFQQWSLFFDAVTQRPRTLSRARTWTTDVIVLFRVSNRTLSWAESTPNSEDFGLLSSKPFCVTLKKKNASFMKLCLSPQGPNSSTEWKPVGLR